MNFPKWSDMPEPQCMVTLSWENVYYIAEPITQVEFKRDPTEKEIKELFEIIHHKGMDMDNSTFWGTLDYHCQEYYDEQITNDATCPKCETVFDPQMTITSWNKKENN